MKRKILMVYPEIPPTYWSFRYAMRFTGKKAAFPPLGLLTVAALMPPDYDVAVVDMNARPLLDDDIAKADAVFISAMVVQRDSFERVVRRCREHGKTVVAGGPFPTSFHDSIEGVDHFVLNEAESTLPLFLKDWEQGEAKRLYEDASKPDITKTPPPRFDLIRLSDYSSMALQYSRGCPHECEFCDITHLFGRIPRVKTPEQFLKEMDILYTASYRGPLFIVDDNFIGNRASARALLPQIAKWQRERGYPFDLFTEVTLGLAGDEKLMGLMAEAGFTMVFAGIETPVEESLAETKKWQNLKMDMRESVLRIQAKGMEVSGGFILGFDADPPDIFERQFCFISETAIPTAMVGLLTAMPHTRLHQRLRGEGRLLADSSGNNTHDFAINFRAAMDNGVLVDGYKRLLSRLYAPRAYFDRCLALLKRLGPRRRLNLRLNPGDVRALFFSMIVQTFSGYGREYWRFIARAIIRRPWMAAEAVALAIKGHHFIVITRQILEVESIKSRLGKFLDGCRKWDGAASRHELERGLNQLKAYRDEAMPRLRKEARRLNSDFRRYAEEALASCRAAIEERIAAMSRQMKMTT